MSPESETRLAIAEARLAAAEDALHQVLSLMAVTANEIGVLSRAVAYLGTVAAFTAPPGVIEDGLKFALECLDEAALQQASRTVQNLRVMWKTPNKRVGPGHRAG